MIEPLFLIAVTAGLVVMFFVARKPVLFWPILIIVNLVGNGPRVQGYFFLDELLSGFIVLGALLRMVLRYKPLQNRVTHDTQKVFFALWIGYMVLQSIVGMVVLHDVRIIRWVLFYFLLGILSAIVYYRNNEFPFPSFRHACLIMLGGSMAAFATYLLQGVVFELSSGLGTWGRFDSQEVFWSGSAYAVFPIILGMPAALFLINDRSFKIKIIAWFSILLFMIDGFYYLSRAIWMAMGLFSIVSLMFIRFKRLVVMGAIFLVLFFGFVEKPKENILPFFEELFSTSTLFTDPTPSDITRNLQARAAFMTLRENWFTLFTGSGVYTNRIRIAPHMKILHDESITDEMAKTWVGHGGTQIGTDIGSIYRTTGFTALFIDSGLIGMVLFTANFFFVGYRLYQRKSQYISVFLMVLIVGYLWLFISNILDIVLLYLIIMPRGIIDQLSAMSRRIPAETI